MFGDTNGGILAEAQGCVFKSVAGKGVLSCDGGLEGGDGTYQGGLVTQELAANGGAFEFGLFGPADQSADRCIVFSDDQPVAGQILRAAGSVVDVATPGKVWTGCRVMAWESETKSLQLVVFDWTADVATGNRAFYLDVTSQLDGAVITAVHAKVISEGGVTVDIARCAAAATGDVCQSEVDVLSTNLTIDDGENSSATAATPAVVDTSNDDLSEGQTLRIDVDAVSATPPKGLIVTVQVTL